MDMLLVSEVAHILNNQFVVIIGDSNQRNVYKDLVLMLQDDRYLNRDELRRKGEHSFLGDELIEGGCRGAMVNGVGYREVRQYRTDVNLLRFYFVTRCYNKYMKSILKDLQKEPLPDVIIMNSCLWDMTRYGRNSIQEYEDNLMTLFTKFGLCLPSSCLVIWTTTLPISSNARGGFLIPEIEFMTSTLRLDIIEANYFAFKEAVARKIDVLDLHFHLRQRLQWRAQDGIHWDMQAHRLISNLILHHVCQAWRLPFPQGKHVIGNKYSEKSFYTADSIVYPFKATSNYIDFDDPIKCHHISPEPRDNLRNGCDSIVYPFTATSNYIDFDDHIKSHHVSPEPRDNLRYGCDSIVYPFTATSNDFDDRIKSHPISPEPRDNLRYGCDIFQWQSYQQCTSHGAVHVNYHSRHMPYSKRKGY